MILKRETEKLKEDTDVISTAWISENSDNHFCPHADPTVPCTDSLAYRTPPTPPPQPPSGPSSPTCFRVSTSVPPRASHRRNCEEGVFSAMPLGRPSLAVSQDFPVSKPALPDGSGLFLSRCLLNQV